MADDRARQLAELEQAYKSGVLSEALYRAALVGLGVEPHAQATAESSGAVAQGAGTTAAGDHGVANSRAGRNIITGDGNSVTTIINYYRDQAARPLDEAALRRQIAGYLAWMFDRYGTIELRGIKREGQQVVQLNLETVYVPLAAKTYWGAWQRQISLGQVVQQGHHIVITGGPGSGKTTVLLHLAWTLALAIGTDKQDLAKEKLGLTGDLPLPILVPLSAYALYRRQLPKGVEAEKKTLAAFISHYLIENQTSFDLPADFFQQLPRHDLAVILLLDGLDEVPNENERAEVRQAIEQLVTGREKMRVVVTCRTAAYKDRTALSKDFREVQVLPLDEDNVALLVRQAYADVYRHDTGLREQKTMELLQAISDLESGRRQRFGEETEPLITSPLMVRMLLVVHYSERRLPDQRAELYMKATDAMLLPEYNPDETVANQIGSLVGENQSVHRELVQYLAFEMHRRGPTQGREIDEDDLRRILDHHPSYPHLTADLISLTKQRCTLLEERLGQYRFLHLAFQEYLAARHLAETVRSESGLDGIAAFLENGPILDSWWREPALLVAGYLSVGTPAMAQKFLRRLAGLDEQAVKRNAALSADVQVAAAEAAGVAALEWPSVPPALKTELAGRLADLFQAPDLLHQAQPTRRAAAGDALARLGDPRPGVIGLETMEFCYVPAGPFMMGEDKNLHQNDHLDYDYWLARYPVTVAQFLAYVAATGNRPEYEDSLHDPANHPVRYITWHEALTFCRWLTDTWREQEFLAAGWQATLPSEAEWEKAARGGLKQPERPLILPIAEIDPGRPPGLTLTGNDQPQRQFPWGKKADPNRANYDDTGLGSTSVVGCFPWGRSIYGCEEMSGNVWEWTRSHNRNYPYDPRDGREVLEAGDKVARILRGGAFSSSDRSVRCAVRLARVRFPVIRFGYFGIRVALVSPF